MSCKNKLIENKTKSKECYNNKSWSSLLNVGNTWYMETKSFHNKPTSKCIGPFKVLDICPNNLNIPIKRNSKRQIVHRNLLNYFILNYRFMVTSGHSGNIKWY